MLTVIGLMVGIYILIRLTSFMCRTGERKEHVIVQTLSFLALLAVVWCLIELIQISDKASKDTATSAISAPP